MGSFDVPLDGERTQLDAFVEEYRSALEDPRPPHRGAGPPPPRPVRHDVARAAQARHVDAAGVVRECVGGTSRQELGLVQNPQESFRLTDGDTVASSRPPTGKPARRPGRRSRLPLDAVVTGHRAGPRTLRWVYLQVLRELAQHCGHADILREQVLAGSCLPFNLRG